MEPATPWKRICYVLAGLIVTQSFFVFRSGYTDTKVPDFSTACDVLTQRFREIAQQTGHSEASAAAGETQEEKLLPWNELPLGADGEIIDNLSSAQCDAAFPDLYHEIDRATAYWKQRNHTISSEDASITWKNMGGDTKDKDWGGAMRLLIHDNQLRILEGVGLFDNPWYRTRGQQTLFLLHRALESATAAGEVLPNIEMALTMSDINKLPNGEEGTHSVWTWNRLLSDSKSQRHWMMPNFDMWRGSGNFSYRDSRLAGKQLDAPFRNKIPKIVWRGAAWVNMDIRGKLIDVTRGKEWADIKKLDGDHFEYLLENDELCKYAMTVHTEGTSYSGRMKWLTNCNSLIFFHEREWDMYYYHLLRRDGPEQNYVAVKRDWSDLEEKVNYYLDHPEEAERIIANSVAVFRERYLTRAAMSCYTRKLIKGYAEVSFSPAVQRPSSDPVRTPRGLPYEWFIMDMHDVGNAHS